MKDNLPLPENKKLTVLFRLEPGCLGPNGLEHIEEFCSHAQQEMSAIDSDFITWLIEPRLDKALEEILFKVENKKLSHEQADKYLNVFEKNLDAFEGHLHDKLSHLIDEYLGH